MVDIGAGNGRLLEELSAIRPDLQLLGIDLRKRPEGLPAQVNWAQDLWDVRYGCWTSGEAGAALAQPYAVVSGRWDNGVVIVDVARAINPANDGTARAVVSRPRVTGVVA